MSTEIAGIERALDALLVAMIEDEARWPEPPLYRMTAKPLDLSGPIPTRADMEHAQLLRQPVYFALRLAVRRFGERVHATAGGTDGMREVADRVADMVPKLSGRRLSMMDSAWDGVGTDADRWWA